MLRPRAESTQPSLTSMPPQTWRPCERSSTTPMYSSSHIIRAASRSEGLARRLCSDAPRYHPHVPHVDFTWQTVAGRQPFQVAVSHLTLLSFPSRPQTMAAQPTPNGYTPTGVMTCHVRLFHNHNRTRTRIRPTARTRG